MTEARNPVERVSIEQVLTECRTLAPKYDELSDSIKEYLAAYIHDGQSLEFYHGYYTSSFQIFALANKADNDFRDIAKYFLWAVARQIVDTYTVQLKSRMEHMKMQLEELKTQKAELEAQVVVVPPMNYGILQELTRKLESERKSIKKEPTDEELEALAKSGW